MILCGIDSSTKKTGISVFENGKYKEHYLLDYSEYDSKDERMKLMCLEIIKTLKAVQPNMVYVEDSWNATNVEVTKTLTMVIGVVYSFCIQNDIEFHTIIPSQWRKCCGFETGKKKRSELKKMSIDYIKEKYDLDVNDDVADSICISIGVLNYYNVLLGDS